MHKRNYELVLPVNNFFTILTHNFADRSTLFIILLTIVAMAYRYLI